MEQSAMAAVILAAGQGTRMKSDRAKVLHELGGEPLVHYPVRLARALGADPLVLVVGHQREAVQAALEPSFPGLTFAVQEEQRGTGHAVQVALSNLAGFEGPILILYGDVPLLEPETVRALAREAEDNELALALVTTKVADPRGYGRIVRDRKGRIQQIVEEKDASEGQRKIDEINAGIYYVVAPFLRDALARLAPQNAQQEYYLTDIVALAIEDGLEVGSVLAKDPREVLGVNTRAELAAMDRALHERTVLRHMLEGVSVVDPTRTRISRQSTVGRDTSIGPGVELRGRCEIGAGCTIDSGSLLTDCKLGDGVTVRAYSVLEQAEVRREAIVGPFARLRPGALVEAGAHVGNFVELKNTKLGKGAKANHLAYLGDATIGEGANIGAGTITCNYDGYGKYPTSIGAQAFIGSNSTLVAPVTIRKDAYVAAGSTITQNVGVADLAFGRARQENKRGYAAALRAKAQAAALAAKEAKAAPPGPKAVEAPAKAAPGERAKARGATTAPETTSTKEAPKAAPADAAATSTRKAAKAAPARGERKNGAPSDAERVAPKSAAKPGRQRSVAGGQKTAAARARAQAPTRSAKNGDGQASLSKAPGLIDKMRAVLAARGDAALPSKARGAKARR